MTLDITQYRIAACGHGTIWFTRHPYWHGYHLASRSLRNTTLSA